MGVQLARLLGPSRKGLSRRGKGGFLGSLLKEAEKLVLT